MKKYIKTYMPFATFVVVSWFTYLGYAYTNFIQVDEIIIDEMRSHARHTGAQVSEIFSWFEENQKVFVPTAVSGNKNPNMQTSIVSTGGQSFSMPLPIDLARRLESKVNSGVNLRFVSNAPLNNANLANSNDNLGIMQVVEAGSVDFFGKSPDSNMYHYVRPILATKSCVSCHVGIAENGLIGALAIDIDPQVFTSSERYDRRTVRVVSVIGSVFAMLLLYVLLLDIWRRQKDKGDDLNLAQNVVTDMSQEIELVLGNMNLLLKELKQAEDNPQMTSLIQNLHNINRDLLDTSFKIRTGEGGEKYQEEIFNVDELFEQCVQLFLPQCNENKVRLKLDISPSVPTHLLGDAYHLRQAVSRLIGLSAMYTQKGNIQVRVRSVMDMPSRFYAKDLNHTPIHLVIEIEDTSVGYVVTDKQSLLQSFSKKMQRNKRLKSRPIISLTPVNEIAAFMDGKVHMLSNSKEGACFKLVGQMKLIDDADVKITPQSSMHIQNKQKDMRALPTNGGASQGAVKEHGHATSPQGIVASEKPVSVIIGNGDISAIPENVLKIYKESGVHVTLVGQGNDILTTIDNPEHGYSVVLLRSLSDMDTSFCATRIRYLERENATPVAIVIIAEDMIQTDLEVMRFFNVSTADNIPRDPYMILKVINLALSTRNNKLFQDGKLLNQTNIDTNTTKLFDAQKALANTKNDKKLLQSICSMWLRFYPKQMERYRATVMEGTHEHKLRLLRSIKNSASTVSLPMLWAEANRLEERLMKGENVRYEKLMLIYENTYEYMKSKFEQ